MKNLKISIIVMLSVLLNQTNVFAQKVSPLTLGVKAGFNYSSLNITFTDVDKFKTGYHFGAFARINTGQFFAVQPELIFSKKGAQVNYSIDFIKGNVALDLQYLDLPILGVAKLSNTFSLQAGPYASVLLDSKIIHNSNIPFLNLSYDLGTNLFSKMDYGFVAGGEMKIGNIGTGVRYNYGLGKVEKVKQILNTDFTLTNARNTVWQVYLTYTF